MFDYNDTSETIDMVTLRADLYRSYFSQEVDNRQTNLIIESIPLENNILKHFKMLFAPKKCLEVS